LVQASYYQSKASTKAATKSANPEWHEEFDLAINKPFGMIEFSVLTASGARLGYLSLPVVELGDQKEYAADWYQLGPKESTDKVSGELNLGFKLTIFEEEWQGVHKGAHAFLSKNMKPATRLLQAALEPGSNLSRTHRADLFKLYSYLYYECGQYKDAISYAEQSIDIKADDAEAFYYLAISYLALGDTTSASKYIERGHDLDPTHPQLKYNKEIVDREYAQKQIVIFVEDAVKSCVKKETDTALLLLTKAQELNPSLPIWGFYFAAVHLVAKNWNAAIAKAMHTATHHSQWVKASPQWSGELSKKGELNPSYKRRWFILKENFYLFYYKNSTDQVPQGVILTYRAINSRNKKDLILKTWQREFKLRANSEADAIQFMNVVDPAATKGPLRIPRNKEMELSISNASAGEDGAAVGRGRIRARIKKKVESRRKAKAALDTTIDLSDLLQHGQVMYMRVEGRRSVAWEKAYLGVTPLGLFKWTTKPDLSEDGISTQTCTDYMDWDGAGVVEVSDQKLGLSLELTNGKHTKLLQFSTEDERDQWKTSIQRAINPAGNFESLPAPGTSPSQAQQPPSQPSQPSSQPSQASQASQSSQATQAAPAAQPHAYQMQQTHTRRPTQANIQLTTFADAPVSLSDSESLLEMTSLHSPTTKRAPSNEVIVSRKPPGVEDRYFRSMGIAPPTPNSNKQRSRVSTDSGSDLGGLAGLDGLGNLDIKLEFKESLEVKSSRPRTRDEDHVPLILNHDPYAGGGGEEEEEDSCCDDCCCCLF